MCFLKYQGCELARPEGLEPLYEVGFRPDRPSMATD